MIICEKNSPPRNRVGFWSKLISSSLIVLKAQISGNELVFCYGRLDENKVLLARWVVSISSGHKGCLYGVGQKFCLYGITNIYVTKHVTIVDV